MKRVLIMASSDYYDIDDIIAENERIPCKFNINVQGLGFLEDTGNESISQNTKLELPIWLAGILSGIPIMSEDDDEVRLLDLIKPDAFNKKVMNSIKSNSTSLALRSILANYYRLAERWGFWFQDAEFVEVIQQMLKERSIIINDYSFNTNANEEINKFIHGLDDLEKDIHKICTVSHKDAKNWLNS